jgi:hypothetical protein
MENLVEPQDIDKMIESQVKDKPGGHGTGNFIYKVPPEDHIHENFVIPLGQSLSGQSSSGHLLSEELQSG